MPADYQLPQFVLSRLRYYEGQFLEEQDFIDEQKYHIDARRRHERLLHVAGVLEGLDVTVNGGTGIDVSPGSAVDDQGRQILLAQAQSIASLPAPLGTLVVAIAFGETATRNADPSSPIKDFTRFTQTAAPVSIQTALPAGAVLLAELTVVGGQITAVDTSKRAYSGVRLPSAGGAGIGLAASGDAAPGWAKLGGSLSVAGVVESVSGGFKFPDGTSQLTAVLKSDVDDLLARTTSLEARTTAVEQALPPGTVVAFAGVSAPFGWLMCDGAAVSRVTYAALFSAIGVSHGAGDGVTTFNVPDYRGRFLRGFDQGTGRDPDGASRTEMAPGGNTGNALGTVQASENLGHSHGVQDPSHSHGQHVTANPFHGSGVRSDYNADEPATGAYPQGVNTMASGTGISLSVSGGAESRPANASVSYLIRV